MTMPPILKIRDPMKHPAHEERSCCGCLKYVFFGRKVSEKKPAKIVPNPINLVASPGRTDLGAK